MDVDLRLWAGPMILVVVLGALLLRYLREQRRSRGPAPGLLHVAARADDTATIADLVTHGVDVDATDEDGNTALHVASHAGRTAAVACLVEHGADQQLRNRFGLTAADMPRLNEAEWLLRQGADSLSPVGTWLNETAGRLACARLRRLPPELYFAALERVGARDPAKNRVVILAIKLGIPGTEPVLVDLLWQVNDSSIAEIYLNSGAEALRAASEAWAATCGYIIRQKHSYHSVTWGVH